ncbi:fibronectin type III-like domain-contianing protein [Halorhabdus amylolytica]|uniref:fibronectin type III-like domain-contianing protein n=1 Tax=Halorhabdus amylolytica TaxID=2559573 RepID=UPI0010A9D76B
MRYTKFEYESLPCSADRIGLDDRIDVFIMIANQGNLTGTEVIHLYVRDVVSSSVTLTLELKVFDRAEIEFGDRTKIVFTLEPPDLTVSGPNGSAIVEPGRF